jgi:hypothetical protein
MARNGTVSRPPGREKTTDVQDISLTYHTIPHVILTYVFFGTHYSLFCSDSCDTGVPIEEVGPRNNRFCPVIGWWTMLHLLVCRVVESNVFSVPDRNSLWNRTEDDLLVQAVAKHSTSDVLFSDVLFPDWNEVASELSGRSKQ